ncbi:heme exporter protein CcmB [Rickettsiales bacterium Ac37b]|nr:heme exporter protein CcmB [Rickettsiales bacterium Ac37b]
MLKEIFFLTKSDILFYIKNPGILFNTFVFILTGNCLFVFALGTDPILLTKLGPYIILVIFFLSSVLLGQDIIIRDYLNGTLELLLVLKPSSHIISSKILTLAALTFLPIITALPIVSIIFSLETMTIMILILAIICSTLALSSMNILSSLLTIHTQHNYLTNLLITTPFMIILVIFASSTIELFNYNSATISLFTPFSCLFALFFILFPITNFLGYLVLKEI